MDEEDYAKLGEALEFLLLRMTVVETEHRALLESLKNWIVAETTVNGRSIPDELKRLNDMYLIALQNGLNALEDKDPEMAAKVSDAIPRDGLFRPGSGA